MNLTAYTPNQLEYVEQLSAMFITPRDIAIMMEIDPAIVIRSLKEENSPLYTAFYKGMLQKEIEINEKYPIVDELLSENREAIMRQLREYKARILIQLHNGS